MTLTIKNVKQAAATQAQRWGGVGRFWSLRRFEASYLRGVSELVGGLQVSSLRFYDLCIETSPQVKVRLSHFEELRKPERGRLHPGHPSQGEQRPTELCLPR